MIISASPNEEMTSPGRRASGLFNPGFARHKLMLYVRVFYLRAKWEKLVKSKIRYDALYCYSDVKDNSFLFSLH